MEGKTEHIKAMTVIKAATTLLAQRPEENFRLWVGFCSRSVAAAIALMTVITQLLLMDKIHFT